MSLEDSRPEHSLTLVIMAPPETPVDRFIQGTNAADLQAMLGALLQELKYSMTGKPSKEMR